MAQPPFKADVFQVEPGSGQTLLIDREPTTGSLQFTDAVVTGGVTLSQLAGLGSVASVFVVGKSGVGAHYTTVQDALNAVPSSSSSSAPSLILVGPGIYQENIVWEKDGVWMFGFGGVEFVNNGVADTLTIQQSVGSTPKKVVLQNIRVKNDSAGRACIKPIGGAGSEVGREGISLINCELPATGVGCYQIDADAVNKIFVQGGNWSDSISTTLSRFQQVAWLEIHSVVGVQALQMDYNNGGAIPVLTGSTYRLQSLPQTGNLQSALTGDGVFEILQCSNCGNVTMSGDRSMKGVGSEIGDLTLNNTIAAELVHCQRGTIAGTGTLAENMHDGTLNFAASNSENYVFAVEQPDVNYRVALEYEVNSLAVTKNKATTGFTVEFPAGPQTTAVNFSVLRQV
jgi:hypothetical protein